MFMTAVDSEYPIDVRHLAVDSGEAMMSYGFEEDMGELLYYAVLFHMILLS